MTNITATAPTVTTISSDYLAQRVGTRHNYVVLAARNAVKRGADPLDFRLTTIPTASNSDVPGFRVSTAGIEQLALGQELAGYRVKAAIYRAIADELRCGDLTELPTVVRKDGQEVLAPNKSEAKNNARKAKRRIATAGTPPEVMFQHGTNRPGVEMIETALFVGCQSQTFRRSVERLKARTDALGSTVFPVTAKRMSGRKRTAELEVRSFALTAEALDELAGQFAKCINKKGRARAAAFTDLAAHLRTADHNALAAE